MRYGGSVEIHDRQSLTPDLYVGAEGDWTGHRLSDNELITVHGTITAIRDCAWSVVTIDTASGIVRIRIT